MKSRIANIRDALRSSFWFVPSLMTLVTVGLSFTTLAVDWTVREKSIRLDVWAGRPDGARELLSRIAP